MRCRLFGNTSLRQVGLIQTLIASDAVADVADIFSNARPLLIRHRQNANNKKSELMLMRRATASV